MFEKFTRKRVKTIKSQMVKFPRCCLIYTMQPFGKKATGESGDNPAGVRTRDSDAEWDASGLSFRIDLSKAPKKLPHVRDLLSETKTHKFPFELTIKSFSNLKIEAAAKTS